MIFKDAATFRMTLGKYRGMTLDQIGTTDAGLRYLDWLRGERDSHGPENASAVDDALAAYLDDETIASAVEKLAKA